MFSKFRTFHRKTTVLECVLIKLIKKRLQHGCFPMKFAKLLRTPVFIKHIQWLLLKMITTSYRSSRPDVFYKKGVLRNLANFIGLQLLLKRDSGTGEFCEISKNTFSYRTPPVAASVVNKSYILELIWGSSCLVKLHQSFLQSKDLLGTRGSL